MLRHFWAIIFCLFGISVLSAQSVDKTVSRALAEYFKSYTSERTQLKFSALDRRKNNIVVNNKTKKVVIYSNEAFAGQAFTPEVVDKIYSDIRAILPKKLRGYKIEVIYKGRAIEERVPNIYRARKDVDAVMLCLPDFWHALVASTAICSGKAVMSISSESKAVNERLAVF